MNMFAATTMNPSIRCRVCGDQATGFNYHCLCCESCKVFFHRNADKSEKFQCAHNNECEINTKTRRICRKCRIDKCFKVGMRYRKPTKNIPESPIVRLQNAPAKSSYTIIENLFASEVMVKLLQEENLRLGDESIAVASQNTTKRYAIALSEYEKIKINEIMHAMDVFVDEYKLPLVGYSSNVYQGFASSEVYAKLIIKFCKRIPAFNLLSPADQFAILKPFCFDLTIIRRSFLYDFERGGMALVLSEKMNEAIFLSHSLSNVYDLHLKPDIQQNRNVALELRHEMECDEKIRDLIIAFALFKRIETTLSCPEFVRYNSAIYSRLLRRYLENKYKSIKLADRKYCNVVKLMNQFETVKAIERKLIANLDRTKMPQLCIELFDI